MAKFLKEVLKHTVTKKAADLGGYTPKAGDEEKFVKKHDIETHTFTDPAIHDIAKKIKPVLTKPEEKRHKDAINPSFKKVAEAKETDTPKCNNTAGGVACPVHGIKECNTGPMKEEEQIDELSTDLLHRAAHKAAKVAMTDVQGRSGPIFKKRAAQANKFRAKGMEQEKKEKAVKEEALDEISTKLALNYAKGASKSMDTAAAQGSAGHETFMKRIAGHKLALDKTNPEHKRLKAKVGTSDANAKDAAYKKAVSEETINEGIQTKRRADLHGKDSKLHHKELKASGYVSKGNNANYKNPEGTEHSYYHAKSNTMHIFRAKGGKINHAFEWNPNHSYAKAHGGNVKEEALEEDGPVAPVPKHLDAHGIAKKFKGFVTGGGSVKTLSHYNTYVKLHAKKTGQHPDAINKEIRKHVKAMKEEVEVAEAMTPKQKAHSHRTKTAPGPKGFVHDPSSNFEAPMHKVEVKASKDGINRKIMHHLRSKDKHSAVFDSQLHYHKKGYKVHSATHKGTVKESDTPITFPNKTSDNALGQNI
jgi:hypothetical protein